MNLILRCVGGMDKIPEVDDWGTWPGCRRLFSTSVKAPACCYSWLAREDNRNAPNFVYCTDSLVRVGKGGLGSLKTSMPSHSPGLSWNLRFL
jgi:hypothetical protein